MGEENELEELQLLKRVLRQAGLRINFELCATIKL